MNLHPSTLTIVIHVLIVVAVGVRVVMARLAPGAALAWLLVVGGLPLIGVLIYLTIGERRVSDKRAERYAEQRRAVKEWIRGLEATGTLAVDWSRHGSSCQRMSRLGETAVGLPTLIGNELSLLSEAEDALRAIIADIDNARSSVHMAFYIWHPGGIVEEVEQALIRARERGVRCRVLVDDLGSAKWLRSKFAERLRDARIEVREALEVGLFRGLVSRGDLRLHRKIVVVDGEVAYTGSMNMVDPTTFKRRLNIGPWVDAMARIEGPIVQALLGSILSDWQRESGEPIQELTSTSDLRHLAPTGDADVQMITSGPGEGTVTDGILQMLMTMFYAAREEIIITTPYFVPDDSMLRALRAAAGHGVRVTLIVPAKVDSTLVRLASRSYFDDLMQVGVEIQQYEGGLLHTKSITVDGRISMFGTVNLDMRSLWLNYEVSLFVYDQGFGGRLRALQRDYLDHCRPVERGAWLARPMGIRFAENVARLLSPLL